RNGPHCRMPDVISSPPAAALASCAAAPASARDDPAFMAAANAALPALPLLNLTLPATIDRFSVPPRTARCGAMARAGSIIWSADLIKAQSQQILSAPL